MNIKKGFTLVELLATIIILAIVLLIAIPTVLNTISKTKKRAFADSAIVVGKDAYTKLNVDFLNGENKLPEDGQNTYIDIDKLNNDDFDRFTGKVRINNENDKYRYYITLDDGEYYLCDVLLDEITPSKVTTKNECDTNEETIEQDENVHKVVIEGNITKIETSYVNGPVLIDGMTPIIWNENGEVVTTTVDDENWFDYSEDSKKWANAQTKDGSMWVWIPRYAYKVTRGYSIASTGNIAVKYLKNSSDTAYDTTFAAPVDQGNNPGSDTKFVTHPAFKFGDTQLEGIWVMKFEASNNNGKAASVPNVTSWRNISNSVMFDNSRKMEIDSSYGWDSTGDSIDTHMLKDVEWGAITYLSWSSYGRDSEIWVNNSSSYTTGCGGNSVDTTTFAGCQNKYNTLIGQNASTTANYYGIYDMSGGAHDRTAGYLIGGNSNLATYGASLVAADPKYVDRFIGSSTVYQTNYDLNTKYYGNAIYETSSLGSGTNSWNFDYSLFPRSASPFLARGGHYDSTITAGPFLFADTDGRPYATNSFRVTLAVKKGL